MLRVTIIACLVVCALASRDIVPIPRGIFDGGKIVNGFDLDIKDAPYQVSIQTRWGFHYCGGSLIAPDIVLTAAHCVDDNPKPSSVYIYLGSSDRASGGIKIAASNIIYHEKYNERPIRNDVALIRLSKSVELSDKIQPIELASSDPEPGTTVLVSGWGDRLEGDERPAPRQLQGVYVSTISLKECRKAYGMLAVQNTNVCAYTEDKDSCQGDSGGPLAADGILVGVVSWGAGCAQRGAPGVYASVAGYSDWIHETSKRL
ncbi:hypothetical protein ACFFRR_003282 [Megaselia abdita]